MKNRTRRILTMLFQIFWSIIGASITIFTTSFFLQIDIIAELFGITPTTRISFMLAASFIGYFIITIALMVINLIRRINRDKKNKNKPKQENRQEGENKR